MNQCRMASLRKAYSASLIVGHPVIVGVPLQDAGEPATLLWDGLVAASQQLALEDEQLGPQPFRVGDPLELETAPFLRLPAYMREAEKLERLRLAETPRLPFWAACRPNSISRVFSAFSSRPNFASLSRRSAQNRSASSRCSNPTTKSSAKRVITTSPCACRVLHW